jgi:hypothetical protein
MNDTEPEIARLVRQRVLERSGTERIMMGSQMFDLAKAMILASLPQELTPMEIKEQLCQRLYGDEVDVAAFIQHLRSQEQFKVLK